MPTKSRRPPPVAPVATVNAERVQKVLARHGLASRREIESWIAAGRVASQGCVLKLGAKIAPGDELTLDGRKVNIPDTTSTESVVLLLNKPNGAVCTRKDPEGRPTVYDLLPKALRRRLVAVGRLDINTSGLLLFTDDGTLAHRLMHPSYEVPREYAVRVFGNVAEDALARLTEGVKIEGDLLKFDAVTSLSGSGNNIWYQCRLHTGRNHEVRLLWESVGCRVSRLIRTSFATLQLAQRIPAGQHRLASTTELAQLYALVDLKQSTVPQARPTVPLPRKTRTPIDLPTRRR